MKKVYGGNNPFVKTIHTMHVFIKGIIGETNCYMHVRFSFDLYKLAQYTPIKWDSQRPQKICPT